MSRRHGASAASATSTAILLVLLSSLPIGGCSLFRPRSPTTTPPASEPDTADSGDAESSREDGGEAASVAQAFPEPRLSESLEADALLSLADTKLAAGDTTAAAETYLRVVDEHPDTDEAAQALFQLAALQLDPSSPLYDSGEAVVTLERIGVDHPQSPMAPAAELLLELTRRNADLERTLQTLEAQLDQLKQLDLASDPSDG